MTDYRRYFSAAKVLALVLLTGSVAFTYSEVASLRDRHPVNPHFQDNSCFECHQARGSRMTAQECYRCHDMGTRALLPNALEDRKRLTSNKCTHPLREESPTKTCLRCHDTVNGYVAMFDPERGLYAEVDISKTHPIGLKPTATVTPATLPLNPNGLINCITCHDQHGTDKRLKLLRLYYPGNGHPPSFQPLCIDCHPGGWTPLSVTDIRAAVRRR